MFCVALVTYKLTIICEINDPSAKYINLEKNLIIRRFGLALCQVWWLGMEKYKGQG